MLDLGTVRPGSTIRIPFSTFDKDDGGTVTMTNFAVGDILIYKDGSTTERGSTSGFTATTDFDSKTGKHLAVIDLADNTTSGFYNAGSEYLVAIDAVTVDSVTVGGWIARFRIGYTGSVLDTTINTLSSQTSFTLVSGPAEDDALNGREIIIHDIASAVQVGFGIILDYTGSTKTVTLVAGVTFTAAAGDNVSVRDPMPLQPATDGRKLTVSSTGEADANVIKLLGTAWLTPGTAGTPDVNVKLAGGTAWNSGAITANTIATDAIDADAIKADAVTKIQNGLATSSGLSAAAGTILAAIAALPTAPSESDIVDELFDRVVGYGTRTFHEHLVILGSKAAGKTSGMDTGVPVFRDLDDTKDVITAAMDSGKNRTTVVLTP